MVIRILLADDSAEYRVAVREFLQQEPDVQVVAEVSDGEAAVTRAAEVQPDVILMDVRMPRTDGILATKAICQWVPATRVLGVSFHADPSLIKGMVDAGAKGYVLKDDVYDELKPAIRAVAAGGTYFSKSLPPPWGTGSPPESDHVDDAA